MLTKPLLFSLGLPALLFSTLAVGAEDNAALRTASKPQQREYAFTIPSGHELDAIAVNSMGLNRAVQDVYTRGIAPAIGNETARHWLGEGWDVFWTYMFIIWPHEMGHWTRGKQGTGDFIIHNYSLPIPYTTVELADNATLEDEIVISIGGFEINSLMARQTAVEYYQKHYSYADTLINSLMHKMFFSFYSFVVIPQDPTKARTWEYTGGDPVHFVLPTYKRYSGRPAVKSDGSVDKELVALYREATTLSLLWNLLDPFFYQSASAFSDKDRLQPARARPWVLGDYQLGWTYGTLFNPSPLGYELYFNNYIYLADRLYVAWMKYGRPFKNNAFGLHIPQLYRWHKLSLGAQLEVWEQDLYGIGGAFASTVHYDLSRQWSLSVKGQWKDRGYQLGERLQQSGSAYLGFSYRH